MNLRSTDGSVATLTNLVKAGVDSKSISDETNGGSFNVWNEIAEQL